MNAFVTLTLTGLLCGSCLPLRGQQIVTLTQKGNGTSSLAIDSDQAFKIHNIMNTWLVTGTPHLMIQKDEIQLSLNSDDFIPVSSGTLNSLTRKFPNSFIIAGPAVLEATVEGGEDQWIMATIEIVPGAYPPGKTAVIGERDGPMKCTLEESTDLVNWTQSTSGATHSLTNANAKKFFRIKLEQDAGP